MFRLPFSKPTRPTLDFANDIEYDPVVVYGLPVARNQFMNYQQRISSEFKACLLMSSVTLFLELLSDGRGKLYTSCTNRSSQPRTVIWQLCVLCSWLCQMFKMPFTDRGCPN